MFHLFVFETGSLYETLAALKLEMSISIYMVYKVGVNGLLNITCTLILFALTDPSPPACHFHFLNMSSAVT